jgi:hypothetical protein
MDLLWEVKLSIRIVINDRCLPLAEELLETTGLDSLSALVTILFTRYGQHLKESWSLPVYPLVKETKVEPEQQQEQFTPINF